MKRIIPAVLICCMMLCGCADLLDGSYVSVKPYQQQSASTGGETVSVSNFAQLYSALVELIDDGREEGVIFVGNYDQDQVTSDMDRAISESFARSPITAYAVESVEYELGKSGGQAALAVSIEYIHDRTEIRKIKQVDGIGEAKEVISSALNQCEVGIVMMIRGYEETDFVQVVENYAMDNPQYVMEQPQVTVGIYPESGMNRVVELRFTYQTSRESLKSMQEQVQPVFTSAALYVSGDAQEQEKYAQLSAFLMERYDYQLSTSITPAYSLLRHGVGDSKAFAMVYAAMCRQAGLECQVVFGTRNAESHYWNIICDNGIYYHVDLLSGSFAERTDDQMTGYVWDYSAYPACGTAPEEPAEEEN